MKSDQKGPAHAPDRSISGSMGIPSCLWFVLGVGAALVLIGLGLLLAWIPAIRKTPNPVGQLAESPSPTVAFLPDDTPPPYSSLDSPTSPTATSTPPSGRDYLEGGSNPALLLLVTPSSLSGTLTITPYQTADAGNFLLQPGMPVSFRWEQYPPGALRYHFTLQPHSGESYITIGIDQDPADGVEVEWVVPENIAGDLHVFAIYENGQVAAVEFAGAVYSGSSSGSSAAENVLREYFRTLSAGEYQAAADLYGGDYAVLQEYNPDVDPANRTGLFQRACQMNGFVCLPLQDILAVQSDQEGQFQIRVSFQKEDGTLFELEDCCGDSPADNPQTEFTFRVAKSAQGHFLVMDLPVYVP